MIFTRVLAVALTALAVSATPSPTTTTKRALSFNPLDAVLTPLTNLLSSSGPAPVKRLTNAQRMSRGLTPNKPNFAARRAPKARRSATPCEPATGVIAITISQSDGSTRNTFLGPPNSFGEFQPTDDVNSAVTVSLCTTDSGPVSITTVSGGFSNFPYLAFIQGFADTSADFGSGSYNYAYLGASTEVPSGSPAVTQPNSFSAAVGVPEGVETDVFTVGAITGASGPLTPSWVNSDGSNPPVTLIYVPSSNAFAITGDAAAFGSNFGSGQPATLSFFVPSK